MKKIFDQRFSILILLVSIIIFLVTGLVNFTSFIYGDSGIYVTLAKNLLLDSKYTLYGLNSTIAPVFPFWLSIIYFPGYHEFSIYLARIFNTLFVLGGVWYFRKTIIQFLSYDKKSANYIVAFFLINLNLISWSQTLYIESFALLFLMLFIYYYAQLLEKWSETFFLILSALLPVLALSKFIFLILYAFVLPLFWLHREKWKSIIIKTLISLIPVFLFFKYSVITHEHFKVHSNLTRFENSSLFDLITRGLLDLDKLPTIIYPLEDFKNWAIALVIMFIIMYGLYLKIKNKNRIAWFLLAFSLIYIIGLSAAGAGNSRYWLFIIPIFIISFWEIWQLSIERLKLKRFSWLFLGALWVIFSMLDVRYFLVQFENLTYSKHDKSEYEKFSCVRSNIDGNESLVLNGGNTFSANGDYEVYDTSLIKTLKGDYWTYLKPKNKLISDSVICESLTLYRVSNE